MAELFISVFFNIFAAFTEVYLIGKPLTQITDILFIVCIIIIVLNISAVTASLGMFASSFITVVFFLFIQFIFINMTLTLILTSMLISEAITITFDIKALYIKKMEHL